MPYSFGCARSPSATSARFQRLSDSEHRRGDDGAKLGLAHTKWGQS
jgi:hypothetical protein